MQNCYPKKIPKELQVEQDDRLSNKHIQTLKFLQEMAAENKELKTKVLDYEEKFTNCEEIHAFAENAKERIVKIQEQYLGKADEINQMLLDKHKQELMQRVEEKLNAEKKWLEEKEKLENEIFRLKKESGQQKQAMEDCKGHDHKIRMLELKVAAQAQELQRLLEANKSLKSLEENQTEELERLKTLEAKYKNVKDENAALVQTNKELNFKILHLEKDLESNKEGDVSQEELINNLRNKLLKLTKENASIETKVKVYSNENESLKNEIDSLRKKLSESEVMRYDLQQRYDNLLNELENLKLSNRGRDRTRENFKEFVQLKREVQQLREEVEFYKLRQNATKSSGHLPSLNISGGSAKGRALKRTGVDQKQKQQQAMNSLYKT